MAHVRPGVLRDRSALARLCRAAVGPDDYVLLYLDEMLRGRHVIVGEEAGRIVAMAGVTECADRALWIGQMRTHPGFRRRGYAKMLLEYARTRAMRENRPALRLWAGHRNIASRTLFKAVGFREVAGFTRMAARALRREGPTLRLDHEGRRAYRLWRQALFCRAGHGYLAYQWHFLPLTREMTRIMARKGEVLVGDEAAVLVWTEEGEPAADAAILSGGRDGLLAARTAAAMRGRPRVEVFLPRHRTVQRWARETGYAPAAWGGHAVLYERRVGGPR